MASKYKMRSRTAKWFECDVKYQKTMDDGLEKTVTEHYVVDALSFTEAEARIINELQPYITGDFKITGIKPAPYGEVFFCETGNVDRWYKVRIGLLSINEKTEKEKKSYVRYLVNASCLNDALRNIDDVFAGTMLDYKSVNISESMILDVFEHKDKEEK